ncbi:maoC family dehydratase [Planomonospora sphaerica]|uniref:MaoC family dehydratase n=1 Tax=Planomonospora sphaerica TaxID=161355 RepID=A0A161LLW8_9ACTN|nr:MaoC family dehydratase [Planomonospora sphaerica]GAT69927.1 maoC family dehydratase [Planomonospora sphaerica]
MTPPRSRTYDEVAVGDTLEELVIPLTRTMIVATAIATRDYQDVHHDPELAVARGSKDVFMNILTTNGLVERFVTAWAGPAAVVTAIRIRLGAPNHPGDTMVLTGAVTAKDDGDGRVEVAVRGANGLGAHVTGTVVVRLPRGGRSGTGPADREGGPPGNDGRPESDGRLEGGPYGGGRRPGKEGAA